MLYESGIIRAQDCPGEKIDHAILVVGYNLEAEIPYFIIKNQLSDQWGDKGFAKLEIVDSEIGTCGINRYASRPL